MAIDTFTWRIQGQPEGSYAQRVRTAQFGDGYKQVQAGQEFWYRARLVDRTGNQGDWIDWVRGQSNGDADDYLHVIGDGFMSSADGDRLSGQIDTNIDAILQNALANNATVDHQWAQYGEVRADILVVKTTIAEVDKAFAEMSTQVQAQIGDVTAALEDKLTATVDATGATAVHTLKAGVRINGVYYQREWRQLFTKPLASMEEVIEAVQNYDFETPPMKR